MLTTHAHRTADARTDNSCSAARLSVMLIDVIMTMTRGPWRFSSSVTRDSGPPGQLVTQVCVCVVLNTEEINGYKGL